ncbi:disintegrin and metalloproteinase domain-containing protein 9-like [Heteronotia binoei]|uniref:disintegrin and metalloproteinase domain-containing protein 9-like n=1 Tax=Heteronotia binoei TaxID=13085 RepID=UPI00293198FA|nr:disintegrin and metalloproteinase domain-containing protein 9-like [Heteronotia binoei]
MHSDSPIPYISYEIIIPRRLEPETGNGKKAERSYIIKAAGKEHIIRLNQTNNFLVENLPVFTYNSEGKRVTSHPYIPTGCYYRGYVEGTADSLVALSTCFGLTGFLKIGDQYYGIEPLAGSQTFQHVLHLTNKHGFNSPVSGIRADYRNHQAEEASGGKIDSVFVQSLLYVRMYIVADNMMFHYEGGNETRVTHLVLNIINMVHTYYVSLKTEVILAGLEVWTERNQIKISKDSAKLVADFRKWKNEAVNAAKHDTTHLFVHQRFDDEPWKTYRGGICKPGFSIGIEPYLTKDLVEFSYIVSHMLGHNLGMDDDGPNCLCDGQTNCIMHASHTKLALFSDCSVASLSELKKGEELACLHDVKYWFRYCGNKEVDVGEQCDCGDEQQCKRDPCCHPNCTLKAKAVCAHEACCQNCQFAPKGTLCRPSASQCDLPEYCPGGSTQCPADVYRQDGTSCGKGAYCYANKCPTHHLQCTEAFGTKAGVAPLSCFRALNMVGNRIGNCGIDGKTREFVKCKEENVLCGRLHCSNVKEQPSLLNYIVRTLINGVPCWSTKYQGPRDKGLLPDGTVCGRDKICMNQTCVPVSILKSECDAAGKCHGKGVCNNRNNCHCNRGWAPPDCRTVGTGGSVDSGSPMKASTIYVFTLALAVVIPVLLLGVVVAILLRSRLRLLFNRCRRRTSG